MAWRFHAIDATLSPWPRRLDGVEAHEGPRNKIQDNLTHWLISTQVTHHKEQPSVGAFGSYEPAASPAPTRSPPPHYGAQPTPAADPFTDPYDVAEAKAEDLYVEGETQEVVPQRKPRIGLGALAKLGGAASRARKAAAKKAREAEEKAKKEAAEAAAKEV